MAKCVDCGELFEQVVYIRPDDSEVAPDPRCRECSAEHERLERHAEHIRETQRISDERRDEWRAALSHELQDRFRAASFDSFDSKLQPAAFKALSSWGGQSLTIASPPKTYGVGKTHLVSALASRLVETMDAAVSVQGYVVRLPRPVIFTTEPLLMDRIHATFSDGVREPVEQVYMELERVRLLIIDDVGKRRPRDPSFTEQVWFRIVDGRYKANRPLILTTNLLPSELEEHIGGAAADRMGEMCGQKGMVVMKGQSYRRQK